MMKIVLASSNTGKIHEFSALLSEVAIAIVPQATLEINDVPETGLSFVENALIKARHAAKQSGLPALADDSGLVVDALQGAPGIYSARYAGINANAQDNIEKLLTDLKAVPSEKRQAYFYCCLVLLAHADDPAPIICTGKWAGTILTEERGQAGFGYDPIFYVPSLGKTAAELPLTEKNNISHRGLASKILLNTLAESSCTHYQSKI